MVAENLVKLVAEKLKEQGVNLDDFCCKSGESGGVKVVCVAPNLTESIKELSSAPRDQVVMARIDGETAEALDAWIASGVAKSRSEAAALFIREGLKVRADELAELQDALNEVQEARERLHARAKLLFGEPD